MTIRIESLSAATFSVNGVPYQRGEYRYERFGDRIEIIEGSTDYLHKTIIANAEFGVFRDTNDNTFADADAVVNELNNIMFL
jgi:hypothetical protein